MDDLRLGNISGKVETFASDIKLIEMKNYIDGVDELAEKLGVEPSVDMAGITIKGKSQNNYSLTEMLVAHIEMMDKVLEKK